MKKLLNLFKKEQWYEGDLTTKSGKVFVTSVKARNEYEALGIMIKQTPKENTITNVRKCQ